MKVFAKSINTEGESEATSAVIFKLPAILCIIGVVAIVSIGGLCLFSSKKKRNNPSEKYLTKSNSNTSSTSSSSSSNSSYNGQVKKEVKEKDITIDVDKTETENVEEQPKRRSVLDSILNRNPNKERRTSNIMFKEDRSLNSISTNEDWINEQKLQAEIRKENQDNLYEDDDEEVNSNDGFWTPDLEPIKSSTDNNQKSYGVPSLGKRNSVIVKGAGSKVKRQGVIIIDDDEPTGEGVAELEKSSELKPTRVKSWKNNDFDEEIKEILKNIDKEDEILNNEQ